WSSSASRSRACPPRWISRKACCSSTSRRSSASSAGRDASTVADDLLIPITADTDVVTARQTGRDAAAEAGFSSGDQTVIAAAISEIARNILMYAKRGEIILGVVQNGDRQGVVVVARDQGPGIPDVARALQDGYSTSGGLGHGADAAAAARAAVAALDRHAEESVLPLVQRCHQALAGTRGVVMSVAFFDPSDHAMTWLGVGNVEGVLLYTDPGARPVRASL